MRRKRKYRLGRRAESIRQTRDRIVVATMELHEEVGVAGTTISAIAERAGVERLTVYRHFPDERELLQACTSHWLQLNPPPDPAQWQGIDDPASRTRTVLRVFGAYYHATAPMWITSYRDYEDVPALASAMDRFHKFLASVRDDLLSIWQPSKSRRRRLAAMIDHALHFLTWQSFARSGLHNREIADVLEACIATAAGA